MKQVWMEGEMKERESGTRTSNRAAASPLSYHRNTSYTLCCPRIEQGSACFIYCGLNEKTTNELTKAYQSQIVSIALNGFLGQL